MTKDHGICYHGGIRRPFVGLEEVKKGKHMGKFSVWLTRGRDKQGVPIKGKKVYLYFWEILRMEGE